MPVSSGLQKYFDSRRGKKDETKAKLDSIARQIDPAFSQSFQDFHDKIMGIIEQHPEDENVVREELEELDLKLQTRKRVHNLKRASTIIDIADAA